MKIIPNQQTPKVPKIDNIDYFIAKNKHLLKQFSEFLYTLQNVSGLAANQITMNGERFMVNVIGVYNFKKREWNLIINPVINEYIGASELMLEGCLSWLNKTVVANRYRAIKISYYDIYGELHIDQKISGYYAQVFQHEIDHLNGIEERVENEFYKLPKKPVIGRNDLCPCKSGKKYKKCCLNN